MAFGPEFLLVASVMAVGILHTMVPDHWAPIALLARQRGWSRGETARAALQAGGGHVATTLLFGLVVWWVGAAASQRFGTIVDGLASAALIAFGLWIAIGSWREILSESSPHHHHGSDCDHSNLHSHGDHHHHHHPDPDDHSHPWERDPLYAGSANTVTAERHVHLHRHDGGTAHNHWHEHPAATAHPVSSSLVLDPPQHQHRHPVAGRTALLLILGSSPMVEGIPAFFAASSYGVILVVVMAVAFAISTIATYVVLSVYSASQLQRISLGPLERYGEVISGGFITLVGIVFALITVI